MITSVRVMVKRWLGRWWFALYRSLASRGGAYAEKAVIVRADGLGDLLFSLPLIEQIRAGEPGRPCELVCESAFADIVRSLGVVDDVIGYDRGRYRRSPFYRWQIWRRLSTVRPTLAVSLQYHRSPTSDELLVALGARRAIAMDGNDEMSSSKDRKRFDRAIHEVVSVPDHVPEVRRYALVAKRLSIAEPSWDRTYSIGSPSIRTRERDTRRVIALAPGASSTLRRWPREHWLHLAAIIQQDPGSVCRWIGGHPDHDLIEQLAVASADVAIAGNVMDLARSIAGSDVVVGSDSGVSHLAVRLGRPTVVILGGGHFSRYFPYGSASICHAPQTCYECNWKCHRPQVDCLTQISPAAVAAEVVRRAGAFDEARGEVSRD